MTPMGSIRRLRTYCGATQAGGIPAIIKAGVSPPAQACTAQQTPSGTTGPPMPMARRALGSELSAISPRWGRHVWWVGWCVSMCLGWVAG